MTGAWKPLSIVWSDVVEAVTSCLVFEVSDVLPRVSKISRSCLYAIEEQTLQKFYEKV